MKTQQPTEIGSRIEQLKQHFRLNNNQLGKMSDVSGQAISDIITGSTDSPKVIILRKIAKALGVSLNWLIEGEGAMLKSAIVSDDVNDTIEFYRSEIQERERQLLETKLQLRERDKLIARLGGGRVGKHRGVSGQPVLALFA